MTIFFIRLFFITAAAVAGYHIGNLTGGVNGNFAPMASGIGALAALFVILLELGSRRVSVKGLSSAVFGLILGLIMARIIISLSFDFITADEVTKSAIAVVLTIVFIYLGMLIAIRGKDEFNLVIPYVRLSRQDTRDEFIILDTSVIIDARIADICKTKFIEGLLIVPRFVLKELQQIADSADSLKRNRGRRGLDVLNRIQKNPSMNIKIHEEDYPEIKEVDEKLVRMAKALGAKILTNDYNLNKIAELQKVTVLNVNELANALKPVILPAEHMTIKIIKEGRESNQGVGYLEDGTMVVVDNARNLIGRTLTVTVSSVLQTSAGKMIFAELEHNNKKHRRPPMVNHKV